MDWMSYTAEVVYTIIIIIQSCIGVLGDSPSVRYMIRTNSFITMKWYEIGCRDHTTWKEYITSSTGKVIIRNAIAVEGARQSRYQDTSEESKDVTNLAIKSVSLDDGGRYRGKIRVPTRNYTVTGDLVVFENIVCNYGYTHTAIIGESITYECIVNKYQGIMFENLAKWKGPGVDPTLQKNNWTSKAVPAAEPGSCYTGQVSYATTIHNVSQALNGTKRECVYFQDEFPIFTLRTGLLIVKCPIGTQGVDCKGTQSCDDKPCDNGGTCIHTQGSIKCMCPNTFHGHFCHKPVGCGLVDCENGGSCIEDVSGKWVSCECAAGYMGDFCQNETIALANVTGENITLAEQETEWMAKKTQTASVLPYLSTLLLLPMASGVAGCILYRRQKVKDQEDDEDDDEDEDEDDDDDESNEDASESQSPSSSADS